MGSNNIAIGTGNPSVATLYCDITITANFDQQASTMYDAEMWNPNSPAQSQLLTFSSGNTTVNATNCPAIAQAGGVVIIPPLTNTNTITLKGVSGDTGVALNPSAPTVWTFPTVPPTSFVLNFSSTTTLTLLWF